MAKNKMLLYGGIGLAAWLLLGKKGSAFSVGGGTFTIQTGSGPVTVQAGQYMVFDKYGNPLPHVYADLASAKAYADTYGSVGQSTVRTGPGMASVVYTSAAMSSSSPSDPTNNNVNWDPTQSPYFQDVVSGVSSFFGL